MINITELNHKSIPAQPSLELLSANVFEADLAMVHVKDMRDQAANNFEQYEVMGRNAMIELMSRVYNVWFNAKASSQFDSFLDKIKQKLKENEVEFRATSKSSGLLIRYVFKHFDDKQVSIYARSLAVAFKKGIAASGFAAFIKNTDGGFAGVRDTDTPPGKGDSEEKIGADIAATHAKTEKTITTIKVTDWDVDEEFRVLIAFRNDDDDADVKNARLSAEGLEAVLLRYEADKKERNKPTKDEEAETNKLALKALESEARNANVKSQSAEAELNDALANGNAAKYDALRVALKVAQLQDKAAEKSYKAFKEAIKAPVTA
jgi:hypothetical protein